MSRIPLIPKPGIFLLSTILLSSCSQTESGMKKQTKKPAKGTVVISEGYETDQRDHGRPVVLIASALEVKPEVFRKAFSGVQPSKMGPPSPSRARANKKVLMDALGKYGVTNDRLDEVSNYYRYNRQRGELWKHKPASVTAIIKDGKLTGFRIDDPGSGYSSVPKIRVAGFEKQKIKAEIQFSKDFKKNGRITSVKLVE